MPTPLGFTRHDHAACIGSTLSRADAICAERGVQFTPVRRRTLELLVAHHAAMGAYEVLEHLSAEGLGDKPPVAYRALSFLVEQGLAHRIERLNAWVACAHPGDDHAPAFLICRGCGSVAEAEVAARGLDWAAEAAGFRIASTRIEAEGDCPACRGAA
jgi:Fur family zinc uptake transcriptional regulator